MKSLFSSFFGTFLIQGLTMISGVLTARLLSPAGKGELTAIILWPTLLTTLSSLGIWDAIVYRSAAAQPADRRQVFGGAMALSCLLALVVALVGYFWLPRLLAQHPPEIVALARLYLGYVPLTFVSVSAMGILQGCQRYSSFNFVRTSVYLFEVVGIVTLWLAGTAAVSTVVTIMLVARLGTAAAAVWLAAVAVGAPELKGGAMMRELLRYGLRIHVGTIADSLNLRLDQLLMSIFLSARVLGLYVVSVTVSAGVGLVTTSLNIVLFPRLSAEQDEAGRWQVLGRFFRLGMILSSAGALVLVVAAPKLIQWFFGTAYLPALAMARVLILAALVACANSMLTTAAKALNLPGLASRAQVTGLIFTGLGLWLLLPRWEGFGAACASLLAYSATCGHLLWGFWRRSQGLLWEIVFPRAADWHEGRRAFSELWTKLGRTRSGRD